MNYLSTIYRSVLVYGLLVLSQLPLTAQFDFARTYGPPGTYSDSRPVTLLDRSDDSLTLVYVSEQRPELGEGELVFEALSRTDGSRGSRIGFPMPYTRSSEYSLDRSATGGLLTAGYPSDTSRAVNVRSYTSSGEPIFDVDLPAVMPEKTFTTYVETGSREGRILVSLSYLRTGLEPINRLIELDEAGLELRRFDLSGIGEVTQLEYYAEDKVIAMFLTRYHLIDLTDQTLIRKGVIGTLENFAINGNRDALFRDPTDGNLYAVGYNSDPSGISTPAVYQIDGNGLPVRRVELTPSPATRFVRTELIDPTYGLVVYVEGAGYFSYGDFKTAAAGRLFLGAGSTTRDVIPGTAVLVGGDGALYTLGQYLNGLTRGVAVNRSIRGPSWQTSIFTTASVTNFDRTVSYADKTGNHYLGYVQGTADIPRRASLLKLAPNGSDTLWLLRSPEELGETLFSAAVPYGDRLRWIVLSPRKRLTAIIDAQTGQPVGDYEEIPLAGPAADFSELITDGTECYALTVLTNGDVVVETFGPETVRPTTSSTIEDLSQPRIKTALVLPGGDLMLSQDAPARSEATAARIDPASGRIRERYSTTVEGTIGRFFPSDALLDGDGNYVVTGLSFFGLSDGDEVPVVTFDPDDNGSGKSVLSGIKTEAVGSVDNFKLYRAEEALAVLVGNYRAGGTEVTSRLYDLTALLDAEANTAQLLFEAALPFPESNVTPMGDGATVQLVGTVLDDDLRRPFLAAAFLNAIIGNTGGPVRTLPGNFSLTPNPAADDQWLTVELDAPAVLRLEAFAADGKKLWERQLDRGRDFRVRLPENLPKITLVRLSDEGGRTYWLRSLRR